MSIKWIKVNVPVTDIWDKPRFESSRLSQALFGQILRVEGQKNNHLFVIAEDNYSGWTNRFHTSPLELDLEDKLIAVIKSPLAKIYSSENNLVLLNTLSFGSIVYYEKNKANIVKLISPHGWIDRKDLMTRKPLKPSVTRIISTMKLFLGTPYLWGGKSGFGIDCSGLVQSVYGLYGIDLPRDSKDQVNCGRRVARKNILKGDLIFSPGHVCVYIGSGKIIHSSLKAGGVKVESIDKSSKFYRGDIVDKITKIKRVL